MVVSNESGLRDLVQRYQVCWEVQPEAVATNHLETIGYQVDLAAALTRSEHPTPDSRPCDVYEALRQIAEWLVSRKDCRSVRFEIEPFDGAVHYSSLRDNRPDVILELKILHDYGLGPVDTSEKCCLQTIQEGLALLGARRGCWHAHSDLPASKYKPTKGAADSHMSRI